MTSSYTTAQAVFSLSLFVLLINCVGWSVLVYFLIVRPIDKKLETPSLMMEKGIPIVSPLLRCSLYSSRILKTPKSNWYDNSLYGDYNFRENATNLQRKLSRVYVYSLRTLMFVLASFVAYQYLILRQPLPNT